MHVRAAAVGVARVTKRSGQRHEQMQQGKDREKKAEEERDLEIEREQGRVKGSAGRCVLCMQWLGGWHARSALAT